MRCGFIGKLFIKRLGDIGKGMGSRIGKGEVKLGGFLDERFMRVVFVRFYAGSLECKRYFRCFKLSWVFILFCLLFVGRGRGC